MAKLDVAKLDVAALAKAMLAAMKKTLIAQWGELSSYAGGEAAKLAHGFEQIVALHAAGRITEGECGLMLEMQKNASRAVLLAVAGMSLLAAEAAINAALGVVRDTVNSVIGFALI